MKVPSTCSSLLETSSEGQLFSFVHRLINLVESFHSEQQFVKLVNLYGSVKHFIQRKVMNGAVAAHDVSAFTVRADKAAPIDFDLVSFANQAEFNGIPKKPPKLLKHVRVLNRRADATIAFEEIRKHTVRMHRYMPKHVVKDVRLGRVLERLAAAQPRCGRKSTSRKHFKECRCRQESTDRSGVPSGSRLKASTD